MFQITKKVVALSFTLILTMVVVIGCSAPSGCNDADATPNQNVPKLYSKAHGVPLYVHPGLKYLGELMSMLDQNNVTNHIHKLRNHLNNACETFHNTMVTYLGERGSRTSQNIDMVKECLEPYHTTMATYLDELRSHTCRNIVAVKECVEPYISQACETAAKTLGSFTALLKVLLKGHEDEWPLIDNVYKWPLFVY